ncbi:MAG: TetR/AcrR family transcriptional regulator [Alcaligenaceae bacterium]|nr:MAG: TetR/AcrR family transcriptional regulator [Alcaligenaceae bacterium]
MRESGASIAEICRRSGLPVGSVYHFFGSKAGILVAVLESRNALLFGSAPELLLVNFQLMRGLYTESAAEDPGVIRGRERDFQLGTEHLMRVIFPVARKRGCKQPMELAERRARFPTTHTIRICDGHSQC